MRGRAFFLTAAATAACAATLGAVALAAAAPQAQQPKAGNAKVPATTPPATPAPPKPPEPRERAALPQIFGIKTANEADDTEIKLVTAAPTSQRYIRLRNDTGRRITFRIDVPDVLVTPGGRETTGLAISRSDQGKWVAIDSAQRLTLEPGVDLQLKIAASLPEPGDYQNLLELAIDGAPATGNTAAIPASRRSFRLNVSMPPKTPEPPPANLLAPPETVALTWGAAEQRVPVKLRNDRARPLDLSSLCIASVTSDGVAYAGIDVPSCVQGPVTVPMGGTTVQVPLPRLAPGKYRADIVASVSQGGPVEGAVAVKVKAHWSVALLVFLIGAALGWVVQQWRTRGRAAYGALREITRLRRRAATLRALGVVALRPAIAAAVAKLADLEAALRTGLGEAAGDAAAVGSRLDLIEQAQALWRHWEAQPYSHGQVFSLRFTALAENLARGETATAASILKRLRADLEQWREHHRHRAFADLVLARLAADPKYGTAKGKLEEEIALADEPLSGEGEEALAGRITQLRAAIKEAEAALAPPSVGTDAVLEMVESTQVPDPGPIDLPFIWLPRPGSSLADIARSQGRWELATNVVAFGLIGLTGVATLWRGSDTWGTSGDIIAALLIAAGAKYLIPQAGGGGGSAAQPG